MPLNKSCFINGKEHEISTLQQGLTAHQTSTDVIVLAENELPPGGVSMFPMSSPLPPWLSDPIT